MNEPLLCVTAAGPTMEDLRRNRDAASSADLVELRLDLVDRPDVAGALEGRRTPVIVTCRAHWEGGHFSGSEEERRRILDSAIAQGAEYVDVEAAAGFAQDVIASRGGRGVIVSSHVFGDPPADLVDRYNALRATGAEVAKLAIQVSTLKETLPLFDLAAKNDHRACPHCDGKSRPADPCAGGPPGQPLDLCRRWDRAGTIARVTIYQGLPVSPCRRRCRALRGRRESRDPFAVADHAQCRLCGAGIEGCLPAARGA